MPVWTIGHSTRSSDGFMELLQDCDIELVLDVRRLPGSRRFPQFNADALSATLDAAGLGYERIASLTGRRTVSHTVPFETNAWWQNRSFHNYADHAMGIEFTQGLDELITLATDNRVALMCSEAVWWRCHRRIIADHLIARQVPVRHIMGPDVVEAELSSGALLGSSGTVTYPGPDPV